MFNDTLDLIIKRYFKKCEREKGKLLAEGCLNESELAEYISNVITGVQRKKVFTAHIATCELCFSKLASGISCLTGLDTAQYTGCSRSTIEKAKSIPKLYPRKTKGVIRQNKYLFIGVIFFILSFVLKRYFAQCLVACIIFGFKWVMDTGGSKALIMIYDTWSGKRQSKEHEKRNHLVDRWSNL